MKILFLGTILSSTVLEATDVTASGQTEAANAAAKPEKSADVKAGAANQGLPAATQMAKSEESQATTNPVAVVSPGLPAGTPKAADTITSALVSTYLSNPTISEERYKLRAEDEGVAKAKSGFRPTITASAKITGSRQINSGTGKNLISSSSPSRLNDNVGQASLQLKQNIYQGGNTLAQTGAAESTVMVQRARLDQAEQSILLEAVKAFMDLLNKAAQLDLFTNNQEFLEKTLEATNTKYNVGEETKTSVAQSESDLAESIARRQTAEGELYAQMATFKRITSLDPAGVLHKPTEPKGMPATLTDAIKIALERNPSLIAARYDLEAAKYTIDQAGSGLLPSLDLVAQSSRTHDWSNRKFGLAPGLNDALGSKRDDRNTDHRASLELSIPIYEAGQYRAEKRRAHETSENRRVAIASIERAVIEKVKQVWQTLLASRKNIEEFKKQVQANMVSLEGTKQEMAVGAKILLDVLNAQRRLVESQVNLINAERSYYIACFELLASIGHLTAKYLNLSVPVYNPDIHYNETKDRWF